MIWTVRQVLQWSYDYMETRSIASPKLDADLLLAHVLGIDRVQLYMQFDRPLEEKELKAFKQNLIRRVKDREPLAYILEKRGFWKADLRVNASVLVPRPETEILVERALEILNAQQKARIADVGTGSGAIACALAMERPKAEIWAIDISPQALKVARENVQNLHLESSIHLLEGHLLDPLPPKVLPLDLVVSNPPYIANEWREKLDPEVLHEPEIALFGGETGLEVIRALIEQSTRVLKENGHLLIEIGFDQGPSVSELMNQWGFQDVEVIRDYSGHDRVVCGRH